MTIKPTISVGIPAHNEAQNIGYLLKSILDQKGNFILEQVIVVCDGCTDDTADIVAKMAAKQPKITLLNDGKRCGKATRLNQIFALNRSQYILALDGDVLLERNCEIDIMITEMLKHSETKVVGAGLVPVKAKTLMGKFSYMSFISFYDAILKYNHGNNYYSLIGCASMIEGKFAKTIKYPKDVVSDMNYLYTLATKKSEYGVRLARDSRVLFRTVSTFHDWRVLAVRATSEDKQNLVKYFGKEVLKDYRMPKRYSITSQLKWLLKNPIYMSGSIFMNIFIRLFPLSQLKPKAGIWEDTRSSKSAIIVN